MLTWLLWLAGFALFAIAGLAVWRAFSNPVFYAHAAVLAWRFYKRTFLKNMSDDDLESWNAMMRASPDNETIRNWHEARRRRLRAEK